MDLGAGVVWRPGQMKDVARTLPLARYYLPPEWLTVSCARRRLRFGGSRVFFGDICYRRPSLPRLVANGVSTLFLRGEHKITSRAK